MSAQGPPTLGPLVEGLISESTREARERRLVELPLELGVARAAALWRILPPPPGFRSAGWRELRALGPHDELPRRAQVQAVFEGKLPAGVAPGRHVLACDLEGAPCALTLGGLAPEREEAIDLVEAVLVAFAAIEEASLGHGGGALLDSLAAPLPRTRQLPPDLRHDVRHHLASIRTTQELLKRYGLELTDHERAHFSEVLEREVRRASGLLLRATGSPLQLSCGAPGSPCSANAVEVVRDVLRSEESASRAAGLQLVVRVDPRCDGLRASVDEIDLERVVRNLVVNAREALTACGCGTHIEVSLAREERELLLVVEDDGPGIPHEERERVLEAGYSRGKSSGSGLGLSVVRTILAARGGRLGIESARTGGARLLAWLPLASLAGEAS